METLSAKTIFPINDVPFDKLEKERKQLPDGQLFLQTDSEESFSFGNAADKCQNASAKICSEDSKEFADNYVSLRDMDKSRLNLSGSVDDLSGSTEYGALKASCSKLRPFCLSKPDHFICNGGHFKDPKLVSFIFGISLHNLLEGMTLGLQTEKAAATGIFFAILMHGFFLASAVTVSLLKNWLPKGFSLKTIGLYCGLLCLVRPFGIVFGLGITLAPGFLIVGAIFQVVTN